MSANFEYNRLHAQSKISGLQQEGIRSQQLKQLKAQKNVPAARNQPVKWFQALKVKLFRPAFS